LPVILAVILNVLNCEHLPEVVVIFNQFLQYGDGFSVLVAAVRSARSLPIGFVSRKVATDFVRTASWDGTL